MAKDDASAAMPAVPNLELANHIFVLRNARLKDMHEASRKALMDSIKSESQAPLLKYLKDEQLVDWDEKLYSQLAAVNEERVAELEKKIADAKESEDELAIIESTLALGMYYTGICDREKAISTLRETFSLTAAAGSKIDIHLTIIRINLFFNDKAATAKELEAAQVEIEKGGDWERKNRYKTYKGVYLMSIRQFTEAADLLIDSFATFTSTELTSYENVVCWGIVCGALALSRVDLKKRIVDSPEILSLAPTTPQLEPLTMLTNSLYTGEYATFLEALAKVETQIMHPSMYLAPHAGYFVREMRCKAYAQLLESYLTLNIKSMANTFGVSVDFLDADLSRLVPQKKLNCVVDKVHGVIITNRPDSKNAQYQQLIKQGDALLTKLQKYGAAVRLYGADQQY
ncbi:26S proteasome regulatory subunit RPN7 [Wickerhamiella sorbophila]|uniref:26S proteasome regulatory subunit RPN7 n=1 Tax=Wickerhamiella sorbophila TaxID=45607 RepID=A0A2T0FE48_9ASCO|nr:26S proteasome regulatory subunit RPN7 [Wickerhamiella sorbophila]PRT53274.1 26S proteasome regulatory subunit RPN7 [Wickerhamiella sorbophila]